MKETNMPEICQYILDKVLDNIKEIIGKKKFKILKYWLKQIINSQMILLLKRLWYWLRLL